MEVISYEEFKTGIKFSEVFWELKLNAERRYRLYGEVRTITRRAVLREMRRRKKDFYKYMKRENHEE